MHGLAKCLGELKEYEAAYNTMAVRQDIMGASSMEEASTLIKAEIAANPLSRNFEETAISAIRFGFSQNSDRAAVRLHADVHGIASGNMYQGLVGYFQSLSAYQKKFFHAIVRGILLKAKPRFFYKSEWAPRGPKIGTGGLGRPLGLFGRSGVDLVGRRGGGFERCRVDLVGRRGLSGELGHVWMFPPALTLQYHFSDLGAFPLLLHTQSSAVLHSKPNSGIIVHVIVPPTL